jgi:hypothetical protein
MLSFSLVHILCYLYYVINYYNVINDYILKIIQQK